MNSKDYQAGVLSTESVPESLQINQISFHAIMSMMVASMQVANLLKRRLYYGKPIPNETLVKNLMVVRAISSFLLDEQERDPVNINSRLTTEGEAEMVATLNTRIDGVNIRLLHASLGMFTESGELIEAMLKQFETGELDKVNFGEELGDSDWYKMIAHSETGVLEEDSRTLNNRKLLDKQKGRYKTGSFTSDQAINRDTAAERDILSGSIPQ